MVLYEGYSVYVAFSSCIFSGIYVVYVLIWVLNHSGLIFLLD